MRKLWFIVAGMSMLAMLTAISCTQQDDYKATYQTDVKVEKVEGDEITLRFDFGRIEILEVFEIPKEKADLVKPGFVLNGIVEVTCDMATATALYVNVLGERLHKGMDRDTLINERKYLSGAEITWLHEDDIEKRGFEKEKTAPKQEDAPEEKVPTATAPKEKQRL